MKVIISGGSGQVGTILARAFHREGHEITVLSRHPEPASWWKAEKMGGQKPWSMDG